MSPTASLTAARVPRKLWSGLGLRLDDSTIRKPPYVHWHSIPLWVRELVANEGGQAPISVVLQRIEEDEGWAETLNGRVLNPQEVFFEAITDEAGGFAFYAL